MNPYVVLLILCFAHLPQIDTLNYVIPRSDFCDVGICWKAPLLQWRFREIATSADVHGFLAMTITRNATILSASLP